MTGKQTRIWSDYKRDDRRRQGTCGLSVRRQYRMTNFQTHLPIGGLLSGRFGAIFSTRLLDEALSRKDLFCFDIILLDRCFEKLSDVLVFLANMIRQEIHHKCAMKEYGKIE